MSDTKTCPACNQAVPVLAVRCRYCGIRLTPQTAPTSSTVEDTQQQKITPPPGGMVSAPPPRVSAPPPRVSAPPPARISVPPVAASSIPAPPGQSLPKPSAPPAAPVIDDMQDDDEDDFALTEESGIMELDDDAMLNPPATSGAPPPPPVSAPPSGPPAPPAIAASTPPAPPAVSSPPPMAAPSAPPVAAPVAAPAAIGGPSRTILGMPSPIAESTPSMPQPLPGAGAPDPNAGYGAGPNAHGYASLDDDDPFDALNLEDDDILLDEIDSDDIGFDQQTAITDVSNIAQEMTEPLEDELSPDLLQEIPELAASETTDKSELFQLDTEPEPRFEPQAQQASSGGVPKLYMIIGAGIAACLVVILVVLLGSDDSDEGLDAETVVASEGNVGEQGNPEGKAAEPGADGEKTGGEAPKKTPAHKCKKLDSYPQFPWRDKLDALARSGGKESICQLFDLKEKDVAAAFKGDPNVGPTGYDLLPDSTAFEIFPAGKPARRGPKAEFVFHKGTLIEIRFKYQMTNAKDIKKNIFTSLLGAPPNTPKDATGRSVFRYSDEDMAITHYNKKDAYERTFNELVFTSNLGTKELVDELETRQRALDAFARGMEHFAARKSSKAIGQFRKAQRLVPSMGLAYVLEGITLLRSEKFDTAAIVARKALENSKDDRVKAGALGLQAVISLYSGFKEMALELFNKAADLDPTDAEFETSAKELKSGSYHATRVAKTAARMSCLKEHSDWSAKGLLARGNFLDNKTFVRNQKKARRSSDYQSAYDMWVGWECQ